MSIFGDVDDKGDFCHKEEVRDDFDEKENEGGRVFGDDISGCFVE